MLPSLANLLLTGLGQQQMMQDTGAILAELRRLHGEILGHLDEMDGLTAKPEPPERLPAVRHELTCASRARTMLLERIYANLIALAPASDKSQIEALQAEGTQNMLQSAKHIGAWSPNDIRERWPAYCSASNQIRRAMRNRIRQEADVIYPLLES